MQDENETPMSEPPTEPKVTPAEAVRRAAGDVSAPSAPQPEEPPVENPQPEAEEGSGSEE